MGNKNLIVVFYLPEVCQYVILMLLTQWTTLFVLGVQFWHTQKLKSEIFNDKKDVYKRKCFFLYKNLKSESLTKNLVTFNFNIMGFTEKSDFFREKWVNQLKGGWVGQFLDLRRVGGLEKREGDFSPILEDRVHAMTLPNQLTHKQIKYFHTIA